MPSWSGGWGESLNLPLRQRTPANTRGVDFQPGGDTSHLTMHFQDAHQAMCTVGGWGGGGGDGVLTAVLMSHLKGLEGLFEGFSLG